MYQFKTKVRVNTGAIKVRVKASEAIKVSARIVSPAGGGEVDIINDDTDEVIESVDAPGEYRVKVISIINGGSPDTIYTNSIIAPAP